MIGEESADGETPKRPKPATPLLGAAHNAAVHNAEATALPSLEALLARALDMADELGMAMVGIDICTALERMRAARMPTGDNDWF